MWYAFALAAGGLQTVRNSTARRIAGRVPATLNSWARFAFNLPWVAALVGVLALRGQVAELSTRFFAACVVAALAQLSANVALVSAFRHATFGGAIVLHKLDAVLAAIVGAALLAQPPSAAGWLGIGACACGAIAIALTAGETTVTPSRAVLQRLARDRGGRLALTAAALLVVASYAVKQAMFELGAANPLWIGQLVLPATALLHVTWIEVVVLSAVLLVREPRAFGHVRGHTAPMAVIGLAAFAASMCWFAAYGAGPVAYVSAIGQVEAVLSVVIGLWGFRERRTLRQVPGAALIVLGVLTLLLCG